MTLALTLIQTLIVWENIDVDRVTLRNQATQEETTQFLSTEQQQNETFFRDAASGVELETVSKVRHW